jgi:methyl-accepting chemotaxis protein
MSLGAKGATIAHISKEIKKNSAVAKNLLENISSIFTLIYDDFKEINTTFSENSSKVELMAGGADEQSAPLEVSSDISRLIECSQFHDIIIQEIDAISHAMIECTDDDSFCLGKSYGVHELAISKMDEVKTKITEIFEEIKEVIKEFLYHINTDIQNIVSRANLVKMEFEQAKEYSDSIEKIVGGLINMIRQTEKELKNAGNGIITLKKFGKSFRNLVVITAVEVARIGDTSLESVVVSMSETERILMTLVDKLAVSLKLWGELKGDFVSVLNEADTNINRLREL